MERKKGFRFRTVTLFYFFVVGLLPLIVFGGISLRHASLALKNEALGKELYMAQAVVNPINSQINEWFNMLELVAKVVKDRGNDFANEFFFNIISNYDYIENIAIEEQGQGKLYKTLFTDSIPNKSQLRKILYKSKHIYYSPGELSSITKEVRIWVAFQDENLTVYLSINLAGLQRLISKISSEASSICMITDENYTIIAHPYKSNILKPFKLSNIYDLSEELVKAESYLIRDGETVSLAVMKYLEYLPWKVIVITPVSRAFKGTYFLAKLAIGGVFVSLFLAIGISLYLSRKTSRPLSELTSAAQKIADGNYNVTFPKRSYQEIEELASHMETMASALKKREEELLLEQKKYRELYEESKRREELYQSLLNASPDPIVIYDLEGRVTYLNPAFEETFRWQMEELKGERIPFVPEEEKKRTFEKIREVIEEGKKVKAFETKRITKDGRLLNISISASIYRDHKGEPAGILAILRDITENKRLEDQFIAAQRLESLGTLAGGIAHNFNNILMGIQGNASLLSMDLPKESVYKKRIQNIIDLVKRASVLTNQLLGFARGGKYQPETLDINTVVRRNLCVFKETREDVKIIENLWPEPLEIEGDQSQMDQVVVNIVQNAYQAMPSGGNLTVETSLVHLDLPESSEYEIRPGYYAKVTIKDTGIGMDEQTIKRIFEPFFTTKPIGVGTGLGLSAVYGIVKNHGGYIEVESEKGKGSTFYVYLPLIDKDNSS